jgi:GNAT superfamily N-acetyltransferase
VRSRAAGRIERVSHKRSAPVTIEAAAPDLPAAAEILRDYLGEMISRYYGRPTGDAEISRHLRAGHGSDDLAEPTGVLLLAHSAAGGAQPRPVGCVGLRRLDEQTRELTRLFVRPEARGAGVAARLLAAAEQRARADGASIIRLNTRDDLVEARALYARHGYREILRYGDDPLAEHWFEKKL